MKNASPPNERTLVKAFVQDSVSKNIIENSLQLAGLWEAGDTVVMGSLAKATNYLNQNRSPEILILDIDREDLPVTRIQALSDFVEPGTRVVVIGQKNDVSLFREFVYLGVNDYLVKPLAEDLVVNCLKRLNKEQVSYEKKGRLIFFTGTRGGVGTSSLLQLVAQSLSLEHFRRIVMVDLDLQFGSLQPASQQTPEYSFKDILNYEERLDDLLLTRSLTQINDKAFVLGNITDLTPLTFPSLQALQRLFGLLQSQFHLVLVDLPRYYMPHIIPLLGEAKSSVLVLSPSLISLRDAVRLKKVAPLPWTFVVNHTQKIKGLTLQEIKEGLNQEHIYEIPYLEKIAEAFRWDHLNQIKTSQLPTHFHDFLGSIVGWGQRNEKPFWKKLTKGLKR